MNIYTHRTETIAASVFIFENKNAYIGMKNGTSYYNVNGIIWEVWQSGCGNYPTTKGVAINNFSL